MTLKRLAGVLSSDIYLHIEIAQDISRILVNEIYFGYITVELTGS